MLTLEGERRESGRVPLEQPAVVRVRARNREFEQYAAQLVDMSSSGLLLECDEDLHVGQRAEVSILWPAKLDNECQLKLVVSGCVIRTEGSRIAVTVEKREFRTAGKAFPPPAG